MRLKTRPQAKPIIDSDLVSMSDIAFLLIVFFMVTTQFMRDSATLDLPRFSEVERTEAGISVALDQDARLWCEGAALGTAAELESELRSLLAGRTEREDREVRFRCHADLVQSEYGPVLEAISAAGGVVCIIIERESP